MKKQLISLAICASIVTGYSFACDKCGCSKPKEEKKTENVENDVQTKAPEKTEKK
ncbi:hypothetical protein ACFLYU_01210 [Candidatus Dependentiae bacterium]